MMKQFVDFVGSSSISRYLFLKSQFTTLYITTRHHRYKMGFCRHVFFRCLGGYCAATTSAFRVPALGLAIFSLLSASDCNWTMTQLHEVCFSHCGLSIIHSLPFPNSSLLTGVPIDISFTGTGIRIACFSGWVCRCVVRLTARMLIHSWRIVFLPRMTVTMSSCAQEVDSALQQHYQDNVSDHLQLAVIRIAESELAITNLRGTCDVSCSYNVFFIWRECTGLVNKCTCFQNIHKDFVAKKSSN